MLTQQEVMATQGTRLSEKAPWETYADELSVKMDDKLAAEVAAYAERRHEDHRNTQMQEELHRQREISEDTAKQYQWLTAEEYADFDARIGRVLSHAEFITMLRKVGVRCWYTQHLQPGKVTLLWQPDPLHAPEVACWVQYGQMPELSLMRFDDHGVPLDERRRGWRTCLLQLILKGVITEETANKTFGAPRQDTAFRRYNTTLQQFRNVGGQLK